MGKKKKNSSVWEGTGYRYVTSKGAENGEEELEEKTGGDSTFEKYSCLK